MEPLLRLFSLAAHLLPRWRAHRPRWWLRSPPTRRSEALTRAERRAGGASQPLRRVVRRAGARRAPRQQPLNPSEVGVLGALACAHKEARTPPCGRGCAATAAAAITRATRACERRHRVARSGRCTHTPPSRALPQSRGVCGSSSESSRACSTVGPGALGGGNQSGCRTRSIQRSHAPKGGPRRSQGAATRSPSSCPAPTPRFGVSSNMSRQTSRAWRTGVIWRVALRREVALGGDLRFGEGGGARIPCARALAGALGGAEGGEGALLAWRVAAPWTRPAAETSPPASRGAR